MLLPTWSRRPGQSGRPAWQVAAVLVFAGFFSSGALAQQGTVAAADELVARYPKGGIQEVGQADRALAEIGQTRARADEQYAADQRACYSKFLSSSCLEVAKERRRAVMEKIAPIEVEATIFKRKANVAERDKALAEKQARDQADAEERLKNLPEKERAAAEKAAQAERKMADSPGTANTGSRERENTTRIQQHEARLKAQQEEEQRKAPERAQNAAAYQKRVEEAQERQRKVQEKKRQKEAERKAKEDALKQ